MDSKNQCPICNSTSLKIFLTRGKVPIHQNVVMKDRASAVNIARGDLRLAVCETCGFVFNQDFLPSQVCYGENYDNTQTCSPFFEQYMTDLVHYLIFEKKVQNCRVLEIGCGKGLFLRKLVETEEAGNSGIGFDPSYVGPLTDLAGRLKFEKRYYGSDCAGIHVDVVICRHVLEHIPDPLNTLRTVRLALANSPRARIFVEVPCVEWILQNHVIWDVFYEHCSYFSADSLTTAFSSSGFKVEKINRLFGGQYLWLEATVSDQEPAAVINPDNSVKQLAYQYAGMVNNLKTDWETKLKQLACMGKIAIWGAGAKGVTFANLIDPSCKWFDCVVDLNPEKQGHYLPGTGHPIVNIPELKKRGIEFAVLMNPNYREEVLALLNKARLKIQLIEKVTL
ncbi:MAG: methyltransferase domain-containing protein [Thermincola sp.]|jgi:SAM-dependent methyltransferase|nr:methyltransferase domain-containing protein [Thermincola sp.]MDT3701657.1 methyltransferase domain-containing protein [Thermincola sp.]